MIQGTFLLSFLLTLAVLLPAAAAEKRGLLSPPERIAALIDPAKLTVNAATSGSDANVFIVSVNYDASGMFIYSLPTFVPAPPSTVVRTAAIPRGGY